MEADEAVGRLDEILGQEPMEESKVQKRPANAAVSFDHVSFTYPGSDRPALNDVSFSVRPGQVTALVGPSGGGKTTAASLIPRFYDIQSGIIRIDGRNIVHIPKPELRARIGFVPQKAFLFSGTILDNFRHGKKGRHHGGNPQSRADRPNRRFHRRPGGRLQHPRRPGRQQLSGGRSSGWPSPGPYAGNRKSIFSTTASPLWTIGPTGSCARP